MTPPFVRAWQVPISCQRLGSDLVMHYFEESADTHRQVKTVCGRSVTPGFALIPLGLLAHRCHRCHSAVSDGSRRRFPASAQREAVQPHAIGVRGRLCAQQA